MRKHISITLLLSILVGLLHTQEQKVEESQKQTFFGDQIKYLMKDGGTWVAKNPTYKKEEQYSAKEYKYNFVNGIHGEQLKLQIRADLNDVGWYLSWDGYYWWNPQKKEIVYHSLAGNGAIATGTIYAPSADTRVNVFKVTAYDGSVTWHKDVSKVVGDDEMLSKSYKLNAIGDWEFNSQLTWKRVDDSGS